MTRVNVQGVQARLPELLGRVKRGEEIASTRNVADSAARVVMSRRAAFYGAWRGQVDMSRFDEADEEIAREFGMLD